MVMYYGLLTTEAVAAKLKQVGLPTDDATVQKAKDAIGRKLDSLENKFPVMLTDAEVEAVCRGVSHTP